MAGVAAYASQIGVDTIAAVAFRYDFQSSSVSADEDFLDTNGLRGTRERAIERVRAGNRRIGGTVVLEPTALELSRLLPWILGGTPTGSATATLTFPLADVIPTRWVVVDKVAKVATYDSVVVNRATISGSQGEPLRISLDLIGGDESIGNAGSFPSLSLDITTQPFIFTDLALSINGATTKTKNIEITIDNHVDPGRFFQSQTVTGLIAMDRTVMCNLTLPYGDSFALYNLGAGGTSCTATFTNGGSVLRFVAGKAAFPRKPIPIPGREEILMPFAGEFFATGVGSATPSLATTLAIGP